MLGNYQEALHACESALGMLQPLGDLTGLENTWDSLGYIHRNLGHYDDAIHCYLQALALSRQLGLAIHIPLPDKQLPHAKHGDGPGKSLKISAIQRPES